MTILRDYGLSFGIALAVSLVATLAVRTLARRMGWVAKPRPDRWHRKPTALYGGVGIVAGFLAAYFYNRPSAVAGDALLVLCSTAMFTLGLADDRFGLKPYAKLVGQIACAALLTAFGLRLYWIPNLVLDAGLSIFWLVGISNALNLLDNIDGAAGGIAALAAAFLVYFCHVQGRPDAALLAAAFAGGVIGFLVFNVNPASIFMGDCGSLFLGFFLGGVSLVDSSVAGARRHVLAVLTIPVLLLLIPIADTTLVTISRRYHGRKVSQGGRDHASHRLVALGLSERAATFFLWGIAAASGGVAVLVKNTSTAVAGFLVAAFAMAVLFVMIFLGRVKVYEPVANESEGAGRALLPTLADFSSKRRIFETLNDLALILLCYYAAFLLRFEPRGAEQAVFLQQFVQSVPLVIVTQLATFLALGLYKGVWRYTGMDDLTRIVRAVVAAVVLSTVALLFVYRFEHFSRAVMVIDGLLLLLAVGGSRISFRVLRSWIAQRRTADGQRVLIYGAGDAGELLLRELQNNHELKLVPVGFVDDDPQKKGRMIHGVPVIGPATEIPQILVNTAVQVVVASTTRIEPERWAEVERTCSEHGLNCRRMRIALE
jgi:UDP-GlcNAc:undecaprenyl-phosphate GlcNAc-1-phosphate transferase